MSLKPSVTKPQSLSSQHEPSAVLPISLNSSSTDKSNINTETPETKPHKKTICSLLTVLIAIGANVLITPLLL